MAEKNAPFQKGYAYREGGKLAKDGKPAGKDLNKKVAPELTKTSGGEGSKKGDAPTHFLGHAREKDNDALSLQGDLAGHSHYDYSEGCHSGYSKKK